MTTAFGAFFGIVGAVGIVLTVHVRKLLRYRRESRGCSLRGAASSVEQRASRAVDREHLAIITWSKAMELHGLPSALEAIDPVWRERAPGWSLVSRFARPPHELGNPTPARVRFLMPDAPDLWMVPGTMLRMFERETQQLAEVFILD